METTGQRGGEISNSTLQTCDCTSGEQPAPPEAIAQQFAARQKMAVDASVIEPVSALGPDKWEFTGNACIVRQMYGFLGQRY